METIHPDNHLKAHIKASIYLGIPLVIAQIVQTLITVIDTIMLGWLGVKELAAGTLAAQTYFLFLIFALGFGAAIIPLITGAIGRNQPKEVRRSARMGLWALIGLSLAFMLPLWFTEEILLLVGQEAELAALADKYMKIAQWSMIPAFILIGLRNFLTGLEQAKIVMWFTLAVAVLNAILNYAFIFGNFGAPRMEIEGAAVATVLATLFGAIITAMYVAKHPSAKEHEIFKRFWKPDWSALIQTIRLGVPISLTILAEAGMFIAVAVLMGWLGTIPLAAHGIANQISSLAFMVPLGLSQVATVRVGSAMGRKDASAVTLATKAIAIIAMCCAGTFALIFITLPEPLIRLFLDFENSQASAVLAYTIPLLFVAAAFQLVDGLQIVYQGALRGMSDTKIPLYIAVISYWPIGLGIAWYFGIYLGFGGIGVWAGLVAGLACAAVLLGYRFYKREQLGLVK